MGAGADLSAEPELVHGTCIAVAKRGVLLRGPSGVGKSDLALRCLAAPPLSSIAGGQEGASALGPLDNEAANRAARGAALLVSDDQVELRREGPRLLARPPKSIAGKLEVRGLGIVELEHVAEAELVLVFDLLGDLADRDLIERMPQLPAAGSHTLSTATYLGVEICCLKIAPFDASAPQKILLALEHIAGQTRT